MRRERPRKPTSEPEAEHKDPYTDDQTMAFCDKVWAVYPGATHWGTDVWRPGCGADSSLIYESDDTDAAVIGRGRSYGEAWADAVARLRLQPQGDEPQLPGEDAAKVQPLPTGNGVDVAVEVAKDLRALALDAIAEDVEARIRLGERKYGTRLKAHNGRDAMLDAYQEILDFLNYIKQGVIEDRPGCQRLYDSAISLAREVKQLYGEANVQEMQHAEAADGVRPAHPQQ